MACLVVGYVLQSYTRFGRYSFVIGGGEDLARLSRISVDRYKILAFVFSGALAGLAGTMESARIGLGHVDIGLGQMFAGITAVVIGGTPLSGGRGGVLQSAIGVLILVVLANGMIFLGISPYIQKSVQGGIILCAMLVATWHLRSRLKDRKVTVIVLRVEKLTKTFGETRALDAVSVEIRSREILGLVGENGAGKSTFLKILAGLYRPDSGEIVLRGHSVVLRGVAAANDAGIGMVFQEQSVLPNLSVAENIMLGYENEALRYGLYNWGKLNELAAAQLAKVDFEDTPNVASRVAVVRRSASGRNCQSPHSCRAESPRAYRPPRRADLRIGSRGSRRRPDDGQSPARVCFGRLHLSPPRRGTAGFGSNLRDDQWTRCRRAFARLCRTFRSSNSLCLDTSSIRNTQGKHRDPRSASGRSDLAFGSSPARADFDRVTFELRAGEILGIAGVEGSGREALCRVLFGADAPDSGEMLLDGVPKRFKGPQELVRAGIGYLPAERRVEGIIGGLSVRANMMLAHLREVTRGPFVDLKREKELASKWIRRLRIKTPSSSTMTALLSGGNQQKVALAKWLVAQNSQNPPSRPSDAGAGRRGKGGNLRAHPRARA